MINFHSRIHFVSNKRYRHEAFRFLGIDLPKGLGSSYLVIRHQVNAEHVQWFHATLGFPPLSSFLKALRGDVEIPGLKYRNGSFQLS